MLRENEALVSQLREAAPDMSVHAPTTLLPSDAAQAHRVERIRRELPRPSTMLDALRHAGETNGFRAGTFAPFAARLPRLSDGSQRLTYEGYVAQGLGDIIGRFIALDDGRWTLATYVFPRDAATAAAAERVVSGSPGDQTMTGIPVVNRELGERFMPQFLLGLGVGSLIVVALIAVTFRDVRLSVLSLVPTVVSLVWAVGALALAGVELDLFAVFAVLTFVGIGVDYGIHLVHRYQERGNAERACAELAPVILVAGAITFLGYGTLVASSYPPLRSIGLVSAVSVIALMASSLFVLPALLGRGRA